MANNLNISQEGERLYSLILVKNFMKKSAPKNIFGASFVFILIIFGLSFFTSQAHAAITDNLAGFWNLNETSGSRADSAGSNTLTEVGGTVSSATGKVDNAASFSGSNYLTIPDNASISMPSTDFTVSGWVYLADKTAVRPILSKSDSTGNQRSYSLWYNNTTDRFEFITSSDGTFAGNVVLQASTFGSPTAGAWYYVSGWYDSLNNTSNIQVNNGSVDSASRTGGVFDNTAPFNIGGVQGVLFQTGKVDSVGVWKRILTSPERTQLYNSGAGFEYPFTVSAPTSLSYTSPNVYTKDSVITPLSPTITGSGLTYAVSPSLPAGLVINASTGIISGTPTAVTNLETYTVTATNSGGSTAFGVSITVKNSSSASNSVQSQVNNLIAMGNTKQIDILKKQYPNQFPLIITSATTTSPSINVSKTMRLTFSKIANKEVSDLQIYLNSKGYNSGIPDGRFGPKTKNAVIKFQLANKLKGDGIVGSKTRDLMK